MQPTPPPGGTGGAGGAGGTPEQLERLRRLTGPPDDELPVAVAINVVLARTPDLVVAVSSAAVSSTGLTLGLVLRTRGTPGGNVGGTGPWPGAAGAWTGAQRPDSPDRWLLGVEYPDGRTASTLLRTRRPGVAEQPLDEHQPRLLSRGGGGGNRVYDYALWLAPLPPPGAFTMVFAWPAQDVEETTTTVDTDPWRQAALQVRRLWDPQPDHPPQTSPPLPPVRLQPGGWFERTQHPWPAQAGGSSAG